MSDDLISRSALIKEMHNFVEEHRNDDEIQWTGYDWLLKEDSVIDIINNLPAAYDVDKVLNELRERTELIRKRYMGRYENVPQSVLDRYAAQ